MPSDPRVLVIDDDMDCATSLTAVLRQLGCRAACGYGASMAVRIAQLFRPDLVFLDLELPGTTGCEVLAEIRRVSDPASRTIYVCLTGSATEHAERLCSEAGFSHFVRKPLMPEQLAALLDEARALPVAQRVPRPGKSARTAPA